MEVQPLIVDRIFEPLRRRAAKSQISLIVEARTTISAREVWLLEDQPNHSVEIIRY